MGGWHQVGGDGRLANKSLTAGQRKRTPNSVFIRWLDKRRDSDINDSSIGETCFDHSTRGTRGGRGNLNAVAT